METDYHSFKPGLPSVYGILFDDWYFTMSLDAGTLQCWSHQINQWCSTQSSSMDYSLGSQCVRRSCLTRYCRASLEWDLLGTGLYICVLSKPGCIVLALGIFQVLSCVAIPGVTLSLKFSFVSMLGHAKALATTLLFFITGCLSDSPLLSVLLRKGLTLRD